MASEGQNKCRPPEKEELLQNSSELRVNHTHTKIIQWNVAMLESKQIRG